MEGCEWFQLSDRARRGDMVDTVSAGRFVMVECNNGKNNGEDESGGEKREKRGARGVRQHFSFEFFLTTVI